MKLVKKQLHDNLDVYYLNSDGAIFLGSGGGKDYYLHYNYIIEKYDNYNAKFYNINEISDFLNMAVEKARKLSILK